MSDKALQASKSNNTLKDLKALTIKMIHMMFQFKTAYCSLKPFCILSSLVHRNSRGSPLETHYLLKKCILYCCAYIYALISSISMGDWFQGPFQVTKFMDFITTINAVILAYNLCTSSVFFKKADF